MSGPKCDAYVLSEEEIRKQREEQERLRQEELRRIREEERKRQEELKRIEEEKRRREEIAKQANALLLRFSSMEEEKRTTTNPELEKKFEEVYEEYRATAKLAEQEADTFEFSEKNAERIIARMEEKIEQWNELALTRRCMQRVNEIIDETIEEMGYELIGERQKEKEEQPSAKLYQYDKDTAISIISANGQFTMEVVTADTTDRQVTEEEALMLEEHMEEFCGDYERFKKRLESKNLLKTTNVFHMPPNKAYARVVNTSSYQNKRKKRKYSSDYTEEVKQKAGYGKKQI